MICNECRGNGVASIRDDQRRRVGVRVCDTCQGSGVDYCCGGSDSELPAGWEAQDAHDCYLLAVKVIGERVAAGAPLPAYFVSDKGAAP